MDDCPYPEWPCHGWRPKTGGIMIHLCCHGTCSDKQRDVNTKHNS